MCFYTDVNTSLTLLLFFLPGFTLYTKFLCPSLSEWRTRAKWYCNTTSSEQYSCLYHEIQQTYVESCLYKPDSLDPGEQFIIKQHPQGVKCRNENRYQPYRISLHTGTACVFRRSVCSEEGQLLYNNGTSKDDRSCRCDFEKGFAFVNLTKNPCKCLPYQEDCSCIKKECPDGYILTPDYVCVDKNNKTYEPSCPHISPKRSEQNKREDRLLRNWSVKIEGYRREDQFIGYIILIIALLTAEPKPPGEILAYGENGNIRLCWSTPTEDLFIIDTFRVECMEENGENLRKFEIPAHILEFTIPNITLYRAYRIKIYSLCNSVQGLPAEKLYYADNCVEIRFLVTGISMESKLNDRNGNIYKQFFSDLNSFIQSTIPKSHGPTSVVEFTFREGSVFAVFLLVCKGYFDETELRNAIENGIKKGVMGCWKISSDGFYFKVLNKPRPPCQVNVEVTEDLQHIVVSWSEAPKTLFKTSQYLIQITTDDWATNEENNVPAVQLFYKIKNILPSTTYAFRVFTCTENLLKSLPSKEEVITTRGIAITTKLSDSACANDALTESKSDKYETISIKNDLENTSSENKATLAHASLDLEVCSAQSPVKKTPNLPNCEVCDNNGPLKSFCVNCAQTFCGTCTEYHQKLLATRFHMLLDISKNDGFFRNLSIELVCEMNCGKYAVYVCIYCKELLCDICSKNHSNEHSLKPINPLLDTTNVTRSDSRSFSSNPRSVIVYDEVSKEGGHYKGEFCKEFTSTFTTDKELVRIRGMAILPDGRIILADSKNKVLKVFNEQLKLKLTEKMKAEPRGLAAMYTNLVAVTIAEKKEVRIYKIEHNTISTHRKLKLNDKPYSVAYDKDFLASETGEADDGKLLILDTDGNEINAIVGKHLGIGHFTGNTIRLALDYTNKSLYIVDITSDSVHCISFKGECSWSVHLKSPRGIVLYKNSLFISSSKGNFLYQINATNGLISVLLDSHDTIKRPRYIAFQKDLRKLVVEVDSSLIKIFQIEQRYDANI
ncbi:unnamed protein product [Mytilus coruscus]|uniref:Fibronectin type-III domain-containing protein n=1 Tax=Mytilus coruscus TaxID=42192 RepID=A0A6J8AJH6_MYTCO|nr:unnamed protein product [Mytilus coruscus]